MLDTLANVKSLLMVSVNTDDALLTRLMNGADAYVASVTNRAFEGGTFTELHDGGSDTIFLNNFPLDGVTSIKVDPTGTFGAGTELPTNRYFVLRDRGMLWSRGGPFYYTPDLIQWPDTVQVVYQTPTSAVPYPVREAFGQLVGHWYRQAKTFADQEYQMLMERTNGTDAKKWSWSLVTGLKVPPGVRQLLEPYRSPVL